MFYVTSLDGSQVEPLINIGTDFKLEQSVDGTFQVSFSCFPSDNNPGYDLLRSESIISVEGNDFKVKQYNDTAFSKTVTAVSTFYEHSKTQKDGIFSGSHTLNNHLAFALASTGWTYTVDSAVANVTNFINNFGDENIIALVNKICKYHQVEYIILPGNKLHFAKQIGGDYDYQYRYKHNVSDVVLVEDTTNLHTFIRGYGANGLAVSYTSPNLSTFGKKEPDPIRDDRFTNAAALTNYIKNSITDVPDLAIESRIPELTSRETGERIWLIYEPLNIEMQTRILKQTKVLRNGELITDSVIFGNTLIKSSIDILVEQQEQINDNKDYINETNDILGEAKQEYTSRIDQTDSRITLEVEQLETSIATVDIKADNINLSVNNRITSEIAAIDVKADNINLSVNNRITNEVAAIDVRANQIESSVSNLATNTNSSITQLSNNINLKIDKGGAITDINLTPGEATINANKINLNGAVVVNGSISGATDISVTRDAYIGNNLNLGYGSFGTTSIIFDNTARISSNGFSMDISSPSVRIGQNTSFSGPVDFSNSSITGLNANTVGNFSFGSSVAGKLDVYRSGSLLGRITFD